MGMPLGESQGRCVGGEGYPPPSSVWDLGLLRYWECKVVAFERSNGCTVSVGWDVPRQNYNDSYVPGLHEGDGGAFGCMWTSDGIVHHSGVAEDIFTTFDKCVPRCPSTLEADEQSCVTRQEGLSLDYGPKLSWGRQTPQSWGFGNASCGPWGNSDRINFPQFWVKEVGQMGTMARHNTQNGQKCGDTHSPFKGTVHKGYNFPCSTIITQTARRSMSVPFIRTVGRLSLAVGAL